MRWYTLSSDPFVGHMFEKWPIFASKHGKNFKGLFTVEVSSVVPRFFYGDVFSHLQSGGKKKFHVIKKRISYRPKGAVHLLKCPRGLLCVGKAKGDAEVPEHKNAVNRSKDEKSPVAGHLTQLAGHVCTLEF